MTAPHSSITGNPPEDKPVTIFGPDFPNFLGAFKGALPGHYRYNHRMFCHVSNAIFQNINVVYLSLVTMLAGCRDGPKVRYKGYSSITRFTTSISRIQRNLKI